MRHLPAASRVLREHDKMSQAMPAHPSLHTLATGLGDTGSAKRGA
jgi:hypothetical protein